MSLERLQRGRDRGGGDIDAELAAAEGREATRAAVLTNVPAEK